MKKILVIIMIALLSVSPVYALDSSGVIYDNSGSGSNATNVNDALNDLYSKLNQKQEELNSINNIGTAGANHILSGYTAYVKGKTVTGTIPIRSYSENIFNSWINSNKSVSFSIRSGYYPSNPLMVDYSEVYIENEVLANTIGLTAAKLAKGQTVLGIAGSYTSDANAVAGNILKDKTAYVNGSKITGSIPSKGATTYTPGTSNQTIASGNYLSGTQTIKGDANLIAANIAKGKTIFGVAGSYTSDANAAAANILSGKTAYVNGSKITGTIATLETVATNSAGDVSQANATGITSGVKSKDDTTSYLYLGIPKNTYTGNNLWIRTPMAEVLKQLTNKAAATYIPNTKDQTIAAGQYLSGIQTIKGDANLIAANIAKGKTIFGVAGTYTSDANAVAANILKDKTAYVNGSKITGTIASKGATTYTPGTKDQTIAAGNYLSGIQTIKGDANLIAANIAQGKTIFGVNGTLKRVLQWENTANGSYKFEKSGDRWIANNRGVNSSTATSTWKVNVASATTAYLSYRTATESPDKLSITLNGTTVLSATGGLKTSETSLTLNLVAGENTLVATYTKDGSVHSYGDMAYVVLPVVGEQGGQYKYQSKSVSASTSSQTIYPDSGYDGLSSVTVGSYSCPTCPSSGNITSAEKLGNTTNFSTVPSGCKIYIFISVAKASFSGHTALYSDKIGSGGTLTWYASIFDSSVAGETITVKNQTLLCLK